MYDYWKSSLCKAAYCNDSVIYQLSEDHEGSSVNQFYIVSSPGTRKLMNHPEVIGFETYRCMLDATTDSLNYLVDRGTLDRERPVDILTILRGGLNYPLEECCWKSGLKVADMNFLSCERVIDENHVITGLDIRYEKLSIIKDCTLMIGDIIATGDTLALCMKHVVDEFRQCGGSIRKIIFFTIGGTRAIRLMEKITEYVRGFWPGFEGFCCFFYEGVFSVYEDRGVTGVNIPDIDFGWRNGVVAPEFRHYVFNDDDALFEKCIIYDGGARRYEIPCHYEEVMEYWDGLAEVAETADYDAFIQEKLGYRTAECPRFPDDFNHWKHVNRYERLPEDEMSALYGEELAFVKSLGNRTLRDIVNRRREEFTSALAALSHS